AEQEQAVRQERVVQRLHSQPVARQEQGLLVAIPQGEGEHTAESLHTPLAPCFPPVHDYFRVAARVEHVAKRLQLRNQRLIVVDLTVENDDDAAVLVEQRLLSGRDVDDRQTAMPEGHAGLEMLTATVGAAMKQ